MLPNPLICFKTFGSIIPAAVYSVIPCVTISRYYRHYCCGCSCFLHGTTTIIIIVIVLLFHVLLPTTTTSFCHTTTTTTTTTTNCFEIVITIPACCCCCRIRSVVLRFPSRFPFPFVFFVVVLFVLFVPPSSYSSIGIIIGIFTTIVNIRLFQLYRSVSLSCRTGSFPLSLSLRVVSILFLFFVVVLLPMILIFIRWSWNWHLIRFE